MKSLIPLPRKGGNQSPSQEFLDKQSFHNELVVDVLARTLWGEARGEGSAGMEAVACVILNRVRIARQLGGYWWGNDIIQVCHKPYQFSCWNKDDPNYRVIAGVDEKDIYFATAKRIARRAMLDQVSDATSGATHYHATGVSPYWSKKKEPVAVIGRHIFYKLLEVA